MTKILGITGVGVLLFVVAAAVFPRKDASPAKPSPPCVAEVSKTAAPADNEPQKQIVQVAMDREADPEASSCATPANGPYDRCATSCPKTGSCGTSCTTAAPAPAAVPKEKKLAKQVKVDAYWIGLQCYALQNEMRAQLKIPHGKGLIVAHVIAGGPADKVGIRPHDVLMKAHNTPLVKIEDLVAQIADSEGKKIPVEVLRQKQTIRIELTPGKRPKQPQPFAENPDWKKLNEWFDPIRSGVDHGPIRLRIAQPGTIIPPGASARAPLPENMTIVITKKGSDPAKVAVQQGNEKWNVTENEIDKLPEKVRTHVGRMLGRMPNQWIGRMPPPGNLKQFDVIPDWGLKIGGTGVEEIESLSPGELKDEIEDHFEDVHGKLDRLLRALEKAHTPKKEASPQKTVEQ